MMFGWVGNIQSYIKIGTIFLLQKNVLEEFRFRKKNDTPCIIITVMNRFFCSRGFEGRFVDGMF